MIKPGYNLIQIGQQNYEVPGTVTVSANGQKILYLAAFGKWRSVVIVDMANDTSYIYDNRHANATIQPGFKNGVSAMALLPMPGVGYDFYPMFQSFTTSNAATAKATMALIGSVTAATSGVIQSMLYLDTTVMMGHELGRNTVSACTIQVPGLPNLVNQIWRFSTYKPLGSILVAGTIDHVSNAPSDPHKWPPRDLKEDGHVRYTLKAASLTSLPKRQYDLESYLPPGSGVSDFRN